MFYLLQNVQTDCGAYPAPYSVGVMLTTHHLALGLRMTGAIPLLPLYLHIVDKAEVKVKVKIMYIEITSPLLYVV
jgi:hypothetical protein